MRDQDRNAIVQRFKDRLRDNDRYTISKESDCEWIVASSACTLSFVFERYPDDDDYMLLVSPPGSRIPGANVGLLRHLRGARDVLNDGRSPENFAEVLNLYFEDVLEGDLSVCANIEKGFAVFLMEALRLPDEDLIKRKAMSFDGSWLSDLKKRKAAAIS